VEDKRKADGAKVGGGEKLLTPIRFFCSPGLLHPRQGRKVTVIWEWKKRIQPRVLATRLEPLIIPSPTSPGSQTRNHAGPLSSPTSPKGMGVGALRFPAASKLWGKRTKQPPYPFDKGSDDSEEELLLSEDSGKRRKRRPNSTYLPRVSREVERSMPRWYGDRVQSSDEVWRTKRDPRPATAGAEGSGGRNRGQSFGRGAASEGEYERVFSHSQGGGISTTRSGRTRRPRTAR